MSFWNKKRVLGNNFPVVMQRSLAKDAKGIEIYRIGTDDSIKIPALGQNMVLNPCLRQTVFGDIGSICVRFMGIISKLFDR